MKKGMLSQNDQTMYAGGTPNFDERTGQYTQNPAGTAGIKPQPTTKQPEEQTERMLPIGDVGASQEETSPQTFTFVAGIETGSGSQDYLYGQEGEVQQLTVDQLREYYEGDDVNRLQEQFGSFDNYLAYMTERESLIQSGDYDIGNWSEADAAFTEDQEMILEGDADLTIDSSDPNQNLENIRRQQTGAQSGAYNNWINSDVNQQLLEKYGVGADIYSDSGDRFRWNGSAYVKVEDASEGAGQYALMGMSALAGAYLGPALGNAIGGGAGAAAGGATGAAGGGITAGGVASAAAGEVLSQAVIQGIVTGSVDTSSLGQAAIMGGLGYIGDTIADMGLADATSDTILADAGAALDNAIWDTADALGTDYDTVLRIGSDIASGAMSGDDVEDIALGALQTYTTSELQNLVRTTYGDSMGNVEVDNVFREGQTDIPIAALNPLIDTAVGAAFGEDVDTADVLDAVYEGLTYSDPDSVDADMTLSFADPGIFEDTTLNTNLVIPQGLVDAVEDIRDVGSAIDDHLYQPYIREPAEAVAQAVGDMLPEGGNSPDLNLPDVDTPSVDLPSVDLPSIDLGFGGGKGGMMTGSRGKKFNLGYVSPELQQQITMGNSDYSRANQAVQALIGRMLT